MPDNGYHARESALRINSLATALFPASPLGRYETFEATLVFILQRLLLECDGVSLVGAC